MDTSRTIVEEYNEKKNLSKAPVFQKVCVVTSHSKSFRSKKKQFCKLIEIS